MLIYKCTEQFEAFVDRDAYMNASRFAAEKNSIQIYAAAI